MKTTSFVRHGHGHRRRRTSAALAALAVATAVVACSGGSGGAAGTSSATATTTASTPAPAANPSLTGAPLFGAPATTPFAPATVTRLQESLDTYVRVHSLVGVTAAVVSDQGSWAGASGKDGTGTALGPTSATMIASATKPFVAAEVLVLASRGLVDLDAPVTDYVTLPFDTAGATVRQVATMTSGFPDGPWTTMSVESSTDPARLWTTDEMLARAATQPRIGTLGGPAHYNGLDYVVLSKVVEKVTGTTLGAAVRRDLLDPVGVERVWVQPEQKPVPPLAYPLADPAQPVSGPAGDYLPSAAGATLSRGGSGIAADAPSLARWTYLLHGGRVIEPSLVTVMETPDPKQGDFSYGFGTMIATDGNGNLFFGHAGDFVGYTSIVFAWTDPPMSVAVLVPQKAATDGDVRADLALELRGHALGSSS